MCLRAVERSGYLRKNPEKISLNATRIPQRLRQTYFTGLSVVCLKLT
jgi:hypothetical protein